VVGLYTSSWDKKRGGKGQKKEVGVMREPGGGGKLDRDHVKKKSRILGVGADTEEKATSNN